MKDLTLRLDALDPEAGAALRVIAYFDSLVANKAGLHALLRAAVVLTSSPAVLIDDARSIRVRIDLDGRVGQPGQARKPAWPTLQLAPAGSLMWLEHDGPSRTIDALVLERAAAAIEPLLFRTRGSKDASRGDEAFVEVLVASDSTPEARSAAARRLGLPRAARVRAVAVHGGAAEIWTESRCTDPVEEGHLRAGVGTATSLDDLPRSWGEARAALRLTAAGTEQDPGPRLVWADRAGSQLLLAELVDAATPVPPDVERVQEAARAAPWMLETLEVIAYSASVRAAASQLRVHHSTAQDRAARAVRVLGWNIDEPSGRLRLQLALVIRRLRSAPRA